MARLSVYDPFAEVFPELFRGFFAPTRVDEGQALQLKVELSETPTEYTVQAEMPGVAKDDVNVEIEGNRVSISGEIKRSSEKKDGERVVHSERYYGSVARSFTLAADVDSERAQAKFENGVLKLTLPKRAGQAGRKLAIS